MDARPAGATGAAGPAGAGHPEMADFQQLIRYVERWRMAHFQRPDPRLSDADDLLRKLRRGMVTAAQTGGPAPAWLI